MAARFAEPEPWCRVAEVLAAASGVPETQALDEQARAVAEGMRGVRLDWAGRPTITWTMATELLASLKAEQARKLAAIEAELVAKDQAFRDSLPAGIPHAAIPEGVSGGLLMMLRDPAAQRARRQTVLEHSLENPAGAIVYTPIGGDES